MAKLAARYDEGAVAARRRRLPLHHPFAEPFLRQGRDPPPTGRPTPRPDLPSTTTTAASGSRSTPTPGCGGTPAPAWPSTPTRPWRPPTHPDVAFTEEMMGYCRRCSGIGACWATTRSAPRSTAAPTPRCTPGSGPRPALLLPDGHRRRDDAATRRPRFSWAAATAPEWSSYRPATTPGRWPTWPATTPACRPIRRVTRTARLAWQPERRYRRRPRSIGTGPRAAM